MPRGSHFHISLVANQQFWHSKIDMRTLLSGFEMTQARLAQSVEHQTFNLRVAGSSPSSGDENFENRKIRKWPKGGVLHGDDRIWTNRALLSCLGAKTHPACWEITF